MIGTGREFGGYIGLDRPGVGVSPNGAGAGHEVGAEDDFGELGVRKCRAQGSLRIDDELLEMTVELIAETAFESDAVVFVEFVTDIFSHVPGVGDLAGE